MGNKKQATCEKQLTFVFFCLLHHPVQSISIYNYPWGLWGEVRACRCRSIPLCNCTRRTDCNFSDFRSWRVTTAAIGRVWSSVWSAGGSWPEWPRSGHIRWPLRCPSRTTYCNPPRRGSSRPVPGSRRRMNSWCTDFGCRWTSSGRPPWSPLSGWLRPLFVPWQTGNKMESGQNPSVVM